MVAHARPSRNRASRSPSLCTQPRPGALLGSVRTVRLDLSRRGASFLWGSGTGLGPWYHAGKPEPRDVVTSVRSWSVGTHLGRLNVTPHQSGEGSPAEA